MLRVEMHAVMLVSEYLLDDEKLERSNNNI